jgi:hypothetical protein
MSTEAERLAAEYMEENSKNADPIVVETPVEVEKPVAVEPTTVVADEVVTLKTETEEVEKISLFDNIDNIDKTETATKEVTSELPESIKAQLAEYEALKAEREAEANSDMYKLLKSGLTLEQIANGITKVDYSSFTTSDLIKLELEKAGLTGEELEEALEEEVSGFNSLTPLAKAKYENELKSNYKTEIKYDEATKLLEDALKANAKNPVSQEEYIKQQEEQTAANIKADTESIDKYLGILKGKGELDDATVEAIKSSYNFNKSIGYLNDDKFDALSFIKNEYKIQNFEKAVAEAEKRGFDKAAKKFGSPEQHGGGGGVGTDKTADQIYEEYLSNATKPKYN